MTRSHFEYKRHGENECSETIGLEHCIGCGTLLCIKHRYGTVNNHEDFVRAGVYQDFPAGTIIHECFECGCK